MGKGSNLNRMYTQAIDRMTKSLFFDCDVKKGKYDWHVLVARDEGSILFRSLQSFKFQL